MDERFPAILKTALAAESEAADEQKRVLERNAEASIAAMNAIGVIAADYANLLQSEGVHSEFVQQEGKLRLRMFHKDGNFRDVEVSINGAYLLTLEEKTSDKADPIGDFTPEEQPTSLEQWPSYFKRRVEGAVLYHVHAMPNHRA